ncbi:hypothetical protein [Vibrio coralliilyticus]
MAKRRAAGVTQRQLKRGGDGVAEVAPCGEAVGLGLIGDMGHVKSRATF